MVEGIDKVAIYTAAMGSAATAFSVMVKSIVDYYRDEARRRHEETREARTRQWELEDRAYKEEHLTEFREMRAQVTANTSVMLENTTVTAALAGGRPVKDIIRDNQTMFNDLVRENQARIRANLDEQRRKEAERKKTTGDGASGEAAGSGVTRKPDD
jgi:hypothetical protein